MKRLIYFLLAIPVSVAAQQVEPVLFSEKAFDFGTVEENGGKAIHDFTFTNNTGRVIRVLSVSASCGCTTPGWTKDPVQPGMTGFVQASFDPKGRPGYFNKSLTVTTDYDAAPIILQIKGQVNSETPAATTIINQPELPAESGSLRFKFSSFPLGKLSINRPPVTKEFIVYNAGKTPVNFTGKVTGPPYIRVEPPKEVAPGDKGIIKVTYDAKVRNQYGFVSDNVALETNDSIQPIKSFSVFATVEEYFPMLSPAEMAKAPVMLMDISTIDFGRIREGNVLEREVTLTNTGKKELSIRAIQGNCACISGTVTSQVIKVGGSVKLKISFTTQGRTGIQQKAVTVYSNDPRNPVQRVTLSGVVEAKN